MTVNQDTRGNLPGELTSFVGRRREIADVCWLLSTSRLVTLTGVGGVGKTRLALRVAARVRRAFRDGVWLVELDRLRDEALVAHTVAAALGVREDVGRAPLEALGDHLAGRELLLVLDNCEHLVDRAAKLADALLGGSAGLRILATSREPLGLAGETLLMVPPLPLPESDVPADQLPGYAAVALFVERAALAVPGFALTEENRGPVVDICRRLDGLPLAIELAVARLRILSPGQISERLDNRMALLNRGSRSSPPRQQTLLASIDWSYELCTRQERELWARLSVLAGSFDLATAEEIGGGDNLLGDHLLELVTGLIDKSVLVREERGPLVLYRLLESLRAYGRQRLRAAGAEAALLRRHRDWFTQLVTRAEADWFGPRQVEWLARLDRDHADIRAALEFDLADPVQADDAVRMAGLLWPSWIAGGHVREGRYWLDRALARDTTPGADRARALWVVALIVGLQGDIREARDRIAECHRILEGSTDVTALAAAARVAGTVEMLAGALDVAVPWFERSIGYLNGAERLDSLALLSHPDLGVVRALGGDVPGAIELCEQGRARCVERGESWALSWTLSVLNFVHIVEDDRRDITPDLLEMLRLKEAFNDILGVLHAVEMLAWVAAARGDAARAARLLGATRHHWRPLGAYLLGFQPYLDRHGRCVERARAALGDPEFEAQFRAGQQLDLPHLIAYAREEPAPPAAAGPEPPSAALTRREQQVAALVAEGLSDRQIAERLVISKRTAETHVANILTKLGFGNRAQVAAWMAAQRQVPYIDLQ